MILVIIGILDLSVVRYSKNTKKHNVSETGCFPALHLRTERDPVFEKLCFFVFCIIPDEGQSKKDSYLEDCRAQWNRNNEENKGRVLFKNVMACRSVARQRPRNKQGVEALLRNRRIKTVSEQRLGKHVSEELLETVFSIRSVQSGYKENNWGNRVQSRVGSSVELCKGGWEEMGL
jgi:hypothetical protein